MKAKLIEESVPVRVPKPGEWLLDPADGRIHICVNPDECKHPPEGLIHLLDTKTGRVLRWEQSAVRMLKFVKPKDAEIPVVPA